MIKARTCAELMGIRGHKRSKWAALTMFIPFVCLVVPWLSFGETRRSIMYSARHTCLDDSLLAKSRFSVMTVLLAISVVIRVAAVRAIAEDAQQIASPKVLTSFLSDMPVAMSLICGCLAMSVFYLISIWASVRSLAQHYERLSSTQLVAEPMPMVGV